MIKAVKDKNVRITWLGVGFVFFSLVKSIFTEYSYDASYHIALSWRHINGDKLFGEMWEPHQTSSTVIDILMILYRFFVRDMTGVALFLQVCGAIFFICIGLLLYKTLSRSLDRFTASIISLLIVGVRPKGMLLIEFSNLLIISSVLLLVSMIWLTEKQKPYFCMLVSVSTCSMILAYPSSIVVFFIITYVLYQQNYKHGLLYLATCISIGCTYVGYLIVSNGYHCLAQNIINIFVGDSSHGVKTVSSIFNIGWDFPYSINFLFPTIILIGFCGRKQLNDKEKYIWKIGTLISISSFIAVFLLTNLGISTICGYLVLGGAVSLIPISKMRMNRKHLFSIGLFIILILSRSLWIMNGYSALNGRFITKMENIIRKGPTIGIIAPLSIVNETSESIDDWQNNIMDEDAVLAVGPWIIDSIVYLYTDANISNYSTIDTTTYSEKLEEYWKMYPEKTPTVVAYKSYYGNNLPAQDSYIGKLLYDEYELDTIGTQWIFYRKK